MKKSLSAALAISLILLLAAPGVAQQKVGINTSNPQAMLHVANGNILFSGDTSNNAGDPPASGAGTRMMWYPDKAAFRAGLVVNTQWNKEQIGFFSFSTGQNTIASGTRAVAMGFGSAALKNNSTALGANTRASGTNSIAGGESTVSRPYASFTIGRFNDSSASSNPDFWVNTDPIFIIGNGIDDLNRRNAFVVRKNGNTDINGDAFISGNGRIGGNATVQGELLGNCTGNASLIPVAYGSIAFDGTINTGTGNYTVTKSTTGEYVIDFNQFVCAFQYTNAGYVTSASVRAGDGVVRIPVTTSINGDLVIRIYNLSNTKVDADFHFVVYRP